MIRKNPVRKLKPRAKKKPPVKRASKAKIADCAVTLGSRGGKATAAKPKPKRKPARRKNPVSESTFRRHVNNAVKLYESFTGHIANKYLKSARLPQPEVGVLIGKCDGILYTTVRDGKTEKYIHEFTGKSCPQLCASADGKYLFFVGGNYRFTQAGIIDK